jgi:hypothetical protein
VRATIFRGGNLAGDTFSATLFHATIFRATIYPGAKNVGNFSNFQKTAQI